jgi:hypothetical protein
MKMPWWMLALGVIAAPVLAQEPPPPPPPIVVPAEVKLDYRAISLTGVTIDDTTDEIGGYLYTPGIANGGGRVMLGSALVDTRLRDNALRFSWLPVSLYVVPIRTKATFVKTGAADVTAKKALPAETIDLGDGRTEVIKKSSRVFTALPEANTTFTYTPTMVYLTVSANAGDLIDFRGPRRLTNERVGIGILRGKQADIPNGVDYDIAKASGQENAMAGKAYAPNQGVRVKTEGIEIGRALEQGKEGWYICYAVGWQSAPK